MSSLHKVPDAFAATARVRREDYQRLYRESLDQPQAFWARMAQVALARQDSGDPFYQAKLATARFYFAKLQPEIAALIRSARAGSATLMDVPAELF